MRRRLAGGNAIEWWKFRKFRSRGGGDAIDFVAGAGSAHTDYYFDRIVQPLLVCRVTVQCRFIFGGAKAPPFSLGACFWANRGLGGSRVEIVLEVDAGSREKTARAVSASRGSFCRS